MNKIKTFEDALSFHGIKPKDFERNCEDLSIDEIAYRKLKLIASALNEGWTPDWSNSDEWKYYPWFDMRSSSSGGFAYDGYVIWYSLTDVGSRLCFKSRDLAEYAGKQFIKEYNEFLSL